MSVAIQNGKLLLGGRPPQVAHILVRAGKIAEISAQPMPGGDEVFDATNLLVVPGLIDIHTHVWNDSTQLGVDADTVGVQSGVTTVVDAGSAGPGNIGRFAEAVSGKKTRVFSLINLARSGLVGHRYELARPEEWSGVEEIEAARAKHAMICGVKARASATAVGEQGLVPIRKAKEAAQALGLPLMVHIGNAPPAFPEVLELLGKGDIVTHCFHGKPGGILDMAGAVLPAVWRARERGVLFDIGHGSSSFSFITARKAITQGFTPDLAGTDVHSANLEGPVYGLPQVMTKLLALGVELGEVVEMVTNRAARALGLPSEVGTITVGCDADLSILEMSPHSLSLLDSDGNSLPFNQLLRPVAVVRAGELIKCTR